MPRTGDFGVFDPNNYVLSHPWTMAGLSGYVTDPNGSPEQILHDVIFRHAEKGLGTRPASKP